MLDNPEKTARLLAALKAAVPFKVELVPSLVAYLRIRKKRFAAPVRFSRSREKARSSLHATC
jgi:hypothetical protein